MSTKIQVYGLLAELLLVTVVAIEGARQEEDCVSNYNKFQDATFSKTTENQFELHRVFYPPNGRQPYSVEVIYQTTLSNGTVADIITDGAGYRNKVWIWLSSPIFIHARPEYLNRLVLYALNNFADWIPPKVNITVPNPCKNRTFDFLEAMTASLSDYASGTNKRTNSRNIVVKKINQGKLYSLPEKENISPSHFNILRILFVTGIFFQVILLWSAFCAVIKSKARKFVDQMSRYSYQYYGLAWGGCVTAAGLLTALGWGVIGVSAETMFGTATPMQYSLYGLYIAIMGLLFTPGIPIAAYFAYKTAPPPVPYIFLLPAALLCCCCRIRHAQSMVFGLGLFLYMAAIQIIMGAMIIVVFAVLAEPLLMITSTLIVILLLFCLASILGVLFTISAFAGRICGSRSMQKTSTVLKAAIFVPLFATVAMYSVGLAASGSAINGSSSNALSTLVSATVPFIIGAVIFGLKKLVGKVLDDSHDPFSEDTATANACTPLLRTDGPWESIGRDP